VTPFRAESAEFAIWSVPHQSNRRGLSVTVQLTRRRLLASLATGAGAALTACGSGSSSSGTASGAGGSGGSGGRTRIKFALDWTPNTNHTGLYVAQAKGYFADSNLEVKILPYGQAYPDTMVSAGAAQFGVSTQDTMLFARASGAKVTSVLGVLQHWASAIGVKASATALTSPKDLDGKIYGGFGSASEKPRLSKLIQDAGGRGDFRTIVLGTSAYQAVYAGRADFTEPFFAWEGIEAELRGTPFKYFKYTDYSFPDAYGLTISGGTEWMAKNPDATKRFVRALQAGYKYAVENPDDAARIVIAANPGVFSNPTLVTKSQAMLSAGYLTDSDGKVGVQTLDLWKGYSQLMYQAGVLAGPSGAKLTAEPDWSAYFTNDYLSA
jgi:ABC-type nitrate/sulfonate/bicarbonate transport system substrate-binding protein